MGVASGGGMCERFAPGLNDKNGNHKDAIRKDANHRDANHRDANQEHADRKDWGHAAALPGKIRA